VAAQNRGLWRRHFLRFSASHVLRTQGLCGEGMRIPSSIASRPTGTGPALRHPTIRNSPETPVHVERRTHGWQPSRASPKQRHMGSDLPSRGGEGGKIIPHWRSVIDRQISGARKPPKTRFARRDPPFLHNGANGGRQRRCCMRRHHLDAPTHQQRLGWPLVVRL